MNPTRQAIHTLLAADGTLTSLLSDGTAGIYHQIAPLDADTPLIVFSKSAGTPTRVSGGDAFKTDVWLIKAVCQGASASPAEDIAARLDTLLNDATLTISGQPSLDLHKQSDVDYLEDAGADQYHHVGAMYRLIRA